MTGARVRGHGPDSPRREYFYTVDREGALLHDGTELCDPAFLQGFFRRLCRDPDERHAEYPFVSVCAGERNYVRAEETVVVFRRLRANGNLEYTGGLTVPFEPSALSVCSRGLLYHRAPVGEFGILGPQVVVALSDRLRQTEEGFEFVSDCGAFAIAVLR